MTNNQLTENSVTQLLNSVKLARDNAERDDNRVDHSFYYALARALEELKEHRKAAMDSEPVAWINGCNKSVPAALRYLAENPRPIGGESSFNTAHLYQLAREIELMAEAPLYRHAQQPVVPFGLHPDTQKLVIDFCTALAEKLYKAQLKYGYDADWKQDGWPSQCQAHFHQHIAKGDPRDVAAYCAFMWYHSWKTEAAQTAPVVTFYRDGIEAAAKWIDKQREAYDSEHGWSDPDTGAFEFGNDTQRGYSSTLEELAEGIRALHPNAGNSQTIPEGYVMVPMRLTAENGAKGVLSGEFSETQFVNCPECFGDDECETCDGSGRIEIKVPVSWTTIKEIWIKGVEYFAAAPQENN
ncbi:MAG: hypothetical protein E6503_12745 [Klebsiella michiganensis]|nr:hypothetical protein [Klebsiella michiganensis]